MEDTTEVRIGSGAMQSRFHRWWLGACVVALLLASWVGGFSVAVTAVFVVIYLTGVTLVGSDDEADIGLSTREPERESDPSLEAAEPAPVVRRPTHEPIPAQLVEVDPASAEMVDDAEPYPDDDEPEPAALIVAEAPPESDDADTLVVVESAAPLDTAVVVETSAAADTTAVVDITEADDAEQTEALIIHETAEDSETSTERA